MRSNHHLAQLTTLLAALGLSAVASAQEVNMKPGNWQTTIQIEMPGMPMKMPPFTTTACVTKKDMIPNTAQKDQDCKVTTQKITGNKITWTVQCKDKKGGVTEGDGQVTYAGETYSGTMNIRHTGGKKRRGPMANMQMIYKMEGKLLGPCEKAPK